MVLPLPPIIAASKLSPTVAKWALGILSTIMAVMAAQVTLHEIRRGGALPPAPQPLEHDD